MMNLLALGLVLTSFVTAGFFTPSPEKQKSKEDVIVKEGHRVVVVEYEKDDGNTKVLISPQESEAFAENVKEKLSEKMEGVKEGMKEASSSVLPNVGKLESEAEEIRHRFRPRELVCDAYGKCKHRIASAIGKTKEAVAEKAHEAAERVEEEAKEAVDKVKETVTHTANMASDKVQDAKEIVKNSAGEVSSKTKEKMSEKASEMKDGVSRTKETAAEKAKEAEKWVEKASDRAKKGANEVKKEGKKELSEILRHAREVVVDVSDYVVLPERVASFAGVLHLMGFAAAYGICVWITFASSYVLAEALPRQQFAMVQSRIYPVYFKAMGYSVGMALLGHLMSPRKRLFPTGVWMLQGFNLMASLGMILVNLLYLEPRATKVMLERMKKEKEEGKGQQGHANEASGRAVDSTAEAVGKGSPANQGATQEKRGRGSAATKGATQEKREEAVAKSQIIHLSENLRRLNSCSSFLNVLTLVSLTWHLVHLGRRLHAVC